MNHPLSFLGGCIVGALAAYYLDRPDGGRRRALVRDKFVSAAHTAGHRAEAKSKRFADRARGVAATGSLAGTTRRQPHDDHQLHERIRSHLGRIVTHPRLVDVAVEDGCVCFTGHALRSEVDRLVAETAHMTGVMDVQSELQLHDQPQELENIPTHGRQAMRRPQPEPVPH